MVKNKRGLALAAVVKVAATSTMTAGICTFFNMIPTLWGAELFPYLTLIVGLENTLFDQISCLYSSLYGGSFTFVFAHCLNQEGYLFTKYFLLEMAFLFIGFLTFVSEIQEFEAEIEVRKLKGSSSFFISLLVVQRNDMDILFRKDWIVKKKDYKDHKTFLPSVTESRLMRLVQKMTLKGHKKFTREDLQKRITDEVSLANEIAELACTPLMLLGQLWIWDKNAGQFNTKITLDTTLSKQQV